MTSYHYANVRQQRLFYREPEEIADLLAFMVSPAAKWMTGTSVRMDGGEIKGI
jgi:3-oxoacyl-[acyl-carrier protein] reductase